MHMYPIEKVGGCIALSTGRCLCYKATSQLIGDYVQGPKTTALINYSYCLRSGEQASSRTQTRGR